MGPPAPSLWGQKEGLQTQGGHRPALGLHEVSVQTAVERPRQGPHRTQAQHPPPLLSSFTRRALRAGPPAQLWVRLPIPGSGAICQDRGSCQGLGGAWSAWSRRALRSRSLIGCRRRPACWAGGPGSSKRRLRDPRATRWLLPGALEACVPRWTSLLSSGPKTSC